MLLNRVNGPSHTSLSRRGFLRGTLGGVTGLAGWQYGGLGTVAAQNREPGGQMTWAVHFSLAPSWFDPAETPGIVSPSSCFTPSTTAS
jgi:peptide/nickel transport system substrate-binding protein